MRESLSVSWLRSQPWSPPSPGLRPATSPIPSAEGPVADAFLQMYAGERPDATAVRALDVLLVLQADHELNASTFAARVIAATLSDMHSAVTGAIGALRGPLHGGANQGVMEMLLEIGSPDSAEDWVRDRLARRELIMGFRSPGLQDRRPARHDPSRNVPGAQPHVRPPGVV